MGLGVRLPSRTTQGTSVVTQSGLRDRVGLAVTHGVSTSTATMLRIGLAVGVVLGRGQTQARPFLILMGPISTAGLGALVMNKLVARLTNQVSQGFSTTLGQLTVFLPSIGGYGPLAPDYEVAPGLPLFPYGALGRGTATAKNLEPTYLSASHGYSSVLILGLLILLPAEQTHGDSHAVMVKRLHLFTLPLKMVVSSDCHQPVVVGSCSHTVEERP